MGIYHPNHEDKTRQPPPQKYGHHMDRQPIFTKGLGKKNISEQIGETVKSIFRGVLTLLPDKPRDYIID